MGRNLLILHIFITDRNSRGKTYHLLVSSEREKMYEELGAASTEESDERGAAATEEKYDEMGTDEYLLQGLVLGDEMFDELIRDKLIQNEGIDDEFIFELLNISFI
eukprot:19168_1